MKKLLSLIKAGMTEEMQLFKIKKSKSSKGKLLLPLFLYTLLMLYAGFYANVLLEELIPLKEEKALLTIFMLLTILFITIEGVYKSSGLLFNCKDDSLLLSLPIKKSTVLFLRVFKFYVFELLFTILILLPSMLVYAVRMNMGVSFYLISILTIIIAPIIPIIISCIVGGITSALSSKFKHKNIVQIIVSMLALIGCLYISFSASSNTEGIVDKLLVINNIAVKYYYTASSYINLISNFNILQFILFIVIHLGLLTIFLLSMSKAYYIINSKIKEFNTSKHKKHITKTEIKSNSVMKSLIKKELKTFINIPVLVVNSVFGVVLFIIAVVALCWKYNDIANSLINLENNMNIGSIKIFVPAVLYALICFTSLTSSVTSSLISLEGKKINILKSIPVKPSTIIISKVLATILIITPVMFIGDIIMFIRFKFNIFEILLCLIASIILPLATQLLGIIINLKYPKMNATTDAEVVKQSMSSSVAVLVGMLMGLLTTGIISTLIVIAMLLKLGTIGIDLVIFISLLIYIIICGLLLLYIKTKGTIKFNNIEA